MSEQHLNPANVGVVPYEIDLQRSVAACVGARQAKLGIPTATAAMFEGPVTHATGCSCFCVPRKTPDKASFWPNDKLH
jgi:hypothetical protein